MPDEMETLEPLDSDMSEIESGDETPESTEEATEETTEEESEDTEKATDETKEGEEETEEEDKDEESEEEEPEIEEVPDGRISVKGLKEQYPDIFKKNPGLKDVIFREREYSKHFGSVEDAQEAAQKVETLDNFERVIMEGDIGSFLDTIADSDTDTAVKLAENFLPALYDRSKPLFAKVTLPVVKATLRNTFIRANNTGNKQLALAVQYITRDLFENPDVIKATEYEPEKPDPRKKEIEQERAKLEQERYVGARTDILNVITNKLKKEIASKLDPKMSEFVRDATVSRIIDEIDSTLANDKAHMAHLSSLWKRVARSGFATEAKSKIISASLARARSVLPGALNRVNASSKKSSVKKAGETKQIPSQTSSNTKQSRSTGKLDRSMSDYDFIKAP